MFAPARRYDYLTAPTEIYRRSFATIRAEADLSTLPEDARTVAVRMIHACGEVGLVNDLAFHPRLVSAARAALEARAVILTDTHMLAAGVTRRRLPADNEVSCRLNDPRAAELAEQWGTTRSAAAVSLWGDQLSGCGGGDWQCPHCALPSAGTDRRRRPATCCDHWDPGRVRRLS